MNAPTIPMFMGLFALTVLMHLLPGVTRPDLFFGVTVDPAFRATPEARRILRDFRFALWCSAAAAATFVWMLHRPLAALVWYVIGTSVAQVASNRRVRIHAVTRSTAIDIDLSAPREHLPGGLAAALMPFVVLLGLGLWTATHLDQLPARLPVHWGFNGPNRWVATSVRAVVGLLVVHVFICLLLVASALGVLHGSRRISASGAGAGAERQFRRRTVLLILSVEYLSILPPAFALLQAPALAMKVWSAAVPLVILAFVAVLMHAGQGGARLTPAGRPPIGDRTSDARWIGGILYFNPTDPALLVERRVGIGWTLNFGNPWSWVLLVALIVMGPALRYLFR